MNAHVLTHRYPCAECSLCFHDMTMLERHVASKHTGDVDDLHVEDLVLTPSRHAVARHGLARWCRARVEPLCEPPVVLMVAVLGIAHGLTVLGLPLEAVITLFSLVVLLSVGCAFHLWAVEARAAVDGDGRDAANEPGS